MPVGGAPEVALDVKLEREVHEGTLVVTVPKDAAILLDGVQKGTGKLETVVGSGGHTLRVTQPGMRPYQTEVFVKDKETRSVDVVLEPELQAVLPQLRVAVGCTDSVPRGLSEGLSVYLDGSPVATPPLTVKKRWSEALNADAVEYVAYETTAGQHAVRVRLADCISAEQVVTVEPRDGADVSGALVSDGSAIWRGPAGMPNGWRVGVAAWLPATGIGDIRAGGVQAATLVTGQYAFDLGSSAGVMVSGGWVPKWFVLLAEAGIGAGKARYTGSADYLATQTREGISDTSPGTWYNAGVRFGPRVPLNLAALSAGLGFAAHGLQMNNVAVVGGNPHVVSSVWAAVDVEPLCDWVLTNTISYGAVNDGPVKFETNFVSLQFGIAFQPNAKCRAERSTDFALHPVGRK